MVVHVLASLGLVGLVLIQHGKGADAGAAFGGGGSGGASQTVFGSQGSGSFLTKLTAGLATTFFITSLTLAYISGDVSKPPTSVLDRVGDETTQQVAPQPAMPEPISDVPSIDTPEAPAAAPVEDDIPAPAQ